MTSQTEAALIDALSKVTTATLTTVLRDCAAALREHDSRTAWLGLVACRGTQTALENLHKDVRNAQEVATYSPTKRAIHR